jgi:hypothetical protein
MLRCIESRPPEEPFQNGEAPPKKKKIECGYKKVGSRNPPDLVGVEKQKNDDADSQNQHDDFVLLYHVESDPVSVWFSGIVGWKGGRRDQQYLPLNNGG